MDLPVVAGVDGSEESLRAVDRAADEAALRGAPLRLVYASLWERYEGSLIAQEVGKPVEEVMARDVMDAAERRAHQRRPGLVVTTAVLAEEPEFGLVNESSLARFVVLGCRGRSGVAELLLGSVSLSVAAHAHCPVIVLRGSPEEPAAPGRVVLGVAGKGACPAAVRFAAEEAALRGVPLEAVRAWRRPAYTAAGHPQLSGRPARTPEEEAAGALEEALRQDLPDGLRVRRRTAEGPARDVLVAASRDAGLLVVGARRRTGRFGLRLGRVAHGVLHHADCPVAVVPEPA
ncbi:universal stress protein [Streptomyces sp. NEAU-sy36]|uniref:universal stress protein n=1 Tax=unclassified Streptomyces TaxID=2593676 RepID=UPI0015D593AB|nr:MULTISPECIES: universal stress protein [unclassified Streptomyces]QLJ02199.1 universal stress protein [Streptomyces sp. NEAU-sy36]